MHVTRLRIKDQLRKRLPVAASARRSPTRTGTGTVERISHPEGDVLESVWNEEWEKNLIDVALSRLKPRVRPEHYQIFYMNVVQRLGVRKVADMLGVSTGQVYLVKHRLGSLLKKELKQLESRAL